MISVDNYKGICFAIPRSNQREIIGNEICTEGCNTLEKQKELLSENKIFFLLDLL